MRESASVCVCFTAITFCFLQLAACQLYFALAMSQTFCIHISLAIMKRISPFYAFTKKRILKEFMFLKGPNTASFCLLLSFYQHNDKYSTKFDYKWKKHRWCFT